MTRKRRFNFKLYKPSSRQPGPVFTHGVFVYVLIIARSAKIKKQPAVEQATGRLHDAGYDTTNISMEFKYSLIMSNAQ